ncbi:MAG: hypothetical protein DI551_01970 [Micavibrio aeruginosavorus]|uniref:SlyX family protein n=1 Tax=Micavibrio aeruginosavorus TaxID=349221 RepID=A0A2W5N6V4_9BACT|nr:MAG: hypothetical protein DI551_01970 [Micavibrio aeruginosavorus]
MAACKTARRGWRWPSAIALFFRCFPLCWPWPFDLNGFGRTGNWNFMVLGPKAGYVLGMEQDRLTKIETMLAHQEQQIQDLSDMLALQGKEIGILKARLDKTQRKLVDLEQGSGADEGEGLSVSEQALRDKPPHY